MLFPISHVSIEMIKAEQQKLYRLILKNKYMPKYKKYWWTKGKKFMTTHLGFLFMFTCFKKLK